MSDEMEYPSPLDEDYEAEDIEVEDDGSPDVEDLPEGYVPPGEDRDYERADDVFPKAEGE